MFLKYSFFLLHLNLIFFSFFFFFIYWQILILHFLVIFSWKINRNRCLLTQLEDYLFGETVIEFYYKNIKQIKRKSNYIVPKYQRISLYISFIIGLIYHLI